MIPIPVRTKDGNSVDVDQLTDAELDALFEKMDAARLRAWLLVIVKWVRNNVGEEATR